MGIEGRDRQKFASLTNIGAHALQKNDVILTVAFVTRIVTVTWF